MNFLIEQIKGVNIITLIAIVIFNTLLSRHNVTKLLKEQNQDIYNQVEELKDTIRERANK